MYPLIFVDGLAEVPGDESAAVVDESSCVDAMLLLARDGDDCVEYAECDPDNALGELFDGGDEAGFDVSFDPGH